MRQVVEAETKVIKTALRMGIEPRVEFNEPVEADILKYRDMGVKHFCMGPDTVLTFPPSLTCACDVAWSRRGHAALLYCSGSSTHVA